MNKIKLNVRQLDGVTLVEQAPEFQLVNGWTQATLPAAAGVLPAGLWGKVPGGDPYLLHVSVLTTGPLGVGDLFELQSGSPSQPRRQYRPTPGNTELVLVRPTDRLRFVVGAQLEVAVELLVESIGGVNELGSRLFAWAQATQASEAHKVTSGVVVAPLQIPAWTGLFHLIHNSANVDLITLPAARPGAARRDADLDPAGERHAGAQRGARRHAVGRPAELPRDAHGHRHEQWR
ncbi:MAG: hypothetical protein IPG88_24205 [Gemmatimonadetes bacterium]|nr:hypothetical protein [Gemmatimonadota bacterium]